MAMREVLYPRLLSFPEADRERVMRAARATPFDVIELVGMAFGLVAAVSLTRYGAEHWDLLERVAAALANFVLAIPLLALLVGPFLVRRIRRGLDYEAARKPPT